MVISKPDPSRAYNRACEERMAARKAKRERFSYFCAIEPDAAPRLTRDKGWSPSTERRKV